MHTIQLHHTVRSLACGLTFALSLTLPGPWFLTLRALVAPNYFRLSAAYGILVSPSEPTLVAPRCRTVGLIGVGDTDPCILTNMGESSWRLGLTTPLALVTFDTNLMANWAQRSRLLHWMCTVSESSMHRHTSKSLFSYLPLTSTSLPPHFSRCLPGQLRL